MDDIRVRGNNRGQAVRANHRPALLNANNHRPTTKQDVAQPSRAKRIVRGLGKIATHSKQTIYKKFMSSSFVRPFKRSRLHQVYAVSMLILFITSTIAVSIQPFLDGKPPTLSEAARQLLPRQNEKLAGLLQFDAKQESYVYNAGYTGTQNPESAMDSSGSPRINASMGLDPAKGVTVTDPTSGINFTLKPKFHLGQGKQDKNQVLYRLGKVNGYLVYTSQITGVKEDIVLNSYGKDSIEFEYELDIVNGLQAKLESNGSIGVYGTDLPINGSNVSTGTKKDKELLEKARQNAKKTKLIFTIPAPVVVENNKTVSQVKSHFELQGNKLKVITENLKGASYPLSIDPSVYVETAQRLMRGNNESNLDFDVSNELIQKGKLTGARFNTWTSSMALPAARWNHGTTVYGGYVYVVGGSSGSTNVANVYWAKFNVTTGAIEAPNPGTGACANWCTSSAYDLPAARAGLSLVAYNGYLYVFGGVDAAGARSNSLYIAKLGLNGEPSLWHPTDSNQNNWTYWYSGQTLTSERSYTAAVAANNRMYLVGGQTNASTGGVATVEKADISPIGTLSAWTTTNVAQLTSGASVRHSHSAQVYNDRLYLIGGNSSGTLQNSVHYIKINSDGTLASSWVATTSFTTARMSWGGNFSTIWGGYIYVAGGCTALTTDNCSAAGITGGNTIQLASINADGSLTDWSDILNVTNARIGYGFVGWRNNLYGIGGCTAHNTTNGTCTTTASATNYGIINQDGDASTVNNSQAYSAGAVGGNPCSGFVGGSSSLNTCSLPPPGDSAGQGGQMSSGVVINNGYIYVIGGCTDISGTDECSAGTAMTGNTSYAALAVDGTLVAPATCTGGTWYGTWCVNSTNRLNGTAGLGAFAAAVFNNFIYVYGGTDGANWQSQVWYVGLNADGSLTGNWTAQAAGAGAGQTGLPSLADETRGYSFMFTRANPSAAGTFPGNLYILGGCKMDASTSNGIGCQQYYADVYKCNITPTGPLSTTTRCTTTGQLQLDSEPGGTVQGIGLMAGVVYANYIYLVGGSSDNSSERGQIMYAKIDNNNNIVSANAGSIWVTSPNQMNPIRRRGFAFGYNGYLYALAGYNGTASLNDLLFAKIDVSDGSIGIFKESLVTVNQRWDLKAVVANGYVYAIGGCGTGAPAGGCTAMTPSIQTFQLYNNYSGSPAGYVAANTTGVDRIGGSSAVLNGYIYHTGGCSDIACTTATNTTYYAPLNSDGTIGTWNLAANTFGGAGTERAWGKLVAVGGTLYYLGGQNNAATAQTTVYYSTPASGVPGAWASGTALPAARTELGATVWNNRIYVTGGSGTNTVYGSSDQSAGGNIGSWTTTGMTAFSVARSGHATIAYAGNLYILGGFDGTNYLNDVQFAKINSDGTVGTWTYTTSLPQRIRNMDGFAANGYMYLFGGRSAASTCTSNTYITPISANTTIASGNNPTGIGDWSQTNVKYAGNRYGAAASYSDGKAYVLGGGCTAFVAAGERAYHSALQSQAQVAKYTRLIDTDTDVFPTKWLMNGLDNDTGARWFMHYRSSTNAAAAWGQDTNFGRVTLGQPENYVPLDGAGANSNFARYYFLNVSIDSSQAFGYPEDVSRGPTINDLALFFSSDPSKRLRHGKTFTGGELQPLDTPF